MMPPNDTQQIVNKPQTTIPRGVREALEVQAGDRLAYGVHPGYAIIRAAPSALVARIRELVGDADFDRLHTPSRSTAGQYTPTPCFSTKSNP